MKGLLHAAKAPATHQLYSQVWGKLKAFLQEHDLAWPMDQNSLSLFISHLFSRKYASTTITTYVSAISYFHRISDHPDPSGSFLVKEALNGARRLNPTTDTRPPLSIPHLELLVSSLDIFLSPYDALAFKSMFSLAFFALLRVSELVSTPLASMHMLGRDSIHISPDGRSLKVVFHSYKHSKPGPPHVITVYRQKPAVCPIQFIQSFFKVRPDVQKGKVLYTDSTGSPYHKLRFASVLKRASEKANLSQEEYSSHSFRIGGATYASLCGMSDSQIRMLGRWSSNAFLRYIRSHR